MGLFDDIQKKTGAAQPSGILAGVEPLALKGELPEFNGPTIEEVNARNRAPRFNGEPVADMPAWEVAARGLKSSLDRPTAGLLQMLGLLDDSVVKREEANNEAIRSRGVGKVAGIAGDVGMFLMPATKINKLGKGGQYAGNAALGMVAGALDPVTEDGESRLQNAAMGAGLGLAG